MRHNRRAGHYEDRISKFARESLRSDFVREAGGLARSFITENPMLSTGLGLAAGFMLGSVIRRKR